MSKPSIHSIQTIPLTSSADHSWNQSELPVEPVSSEGVPHGQFIYFFFSFFLFQSYVGVHVIKQWLKKRLKVRFILPVCMDTVVPGMR